MNFWDVQTVRNFLKGIISFLGMAVLIKVEVLHTHAYVAL
jgi:hypothetical protein